ncbi:dihydrolipoyllysine-residue acetyltransferase component of pyruvate dehydrogenase complex [mine drainage metagenome]|uniref:Dihydrolipoyllysine-residue acetyltransferase component of pyruvate dehydrogenase complex n=1 Tax=mine drainage metagenome TaxID=410659 RepID=A0A1J5PYC1_9ZZZZ
MLVGAPIAVLTKSGEGKAEIDALLAEQNLDTASEVAPAASAVSEAAPVAAPVAAPSQDLSGKRIFASPLARRLARERGLDTGSLVGSGPGGRIVRRDIEAAPQRAAAGGAGAKAPTKPVSTGSYTAIPHTPMRRAIARRLTESKTTVPHFYLVSECRADELLKLRKSWNEWATEKISVNDLVMKAVSAAFQDVPDANVIWTPEELRRFDDVDISMAVAAPNGLITPVVRGVNHLSLAELGATTAELVSRARSGRLRQDEIEGGSFSVTNLGMYGTQEFSAILNPPQSAILAVGAARQEAVVTDGQIAVANVIHFTLSVDHRAIDGALAAQWLAAFTKRIENPFWVVM